MTAIPIQKLPLSKKTEEWKKSNIKYFVGRCSLGYLYDRIETTGVSRSLTRNRIYNMIVNYDIYNSRFSKRDIEYIRNPMGIEGDDTFPTSPQNINITRPAIDALIGHKTERISDILVLDTTPEMVDTLQELRKDMLYQNVVQEINSIMDPESKGTSYEKINEYVNYTYKNIYEKVGQFFVNRARGRYDMDTMFVDCFKDSMIGGEELAYVGYRGEDLRVEWVNPVYCDYERHPGMSKVDEAEWFVRKIPMTPSRVIDNWDFTDTELDDLYQTYGLSSVNAIGDDSVHFIRRRVGEDFFLNADVIPVYHVVWWGLHRIGFVTTKDPEGVEQMMIVGEGYKLQDGETIEWEWEKELWEGYQIGERIFKDIMPVPHQCWPYIGSIMSNTNSDNVSLIGLMKPLQYTYIEIFYRLMLMLARDKGKIINIDITQIPKSMGVDFKTWAHYLSAIGINLINPYEEGWEIKRNNTAATFNQFGSIDLTMAPVIDQYVRLLGKIEQMIGRISGVPEQRLGDIKPSELVGNVENAIIQSTVVTEPYFIKHMDFEKRVYDAILKLSMKLAKNGDMRLLSSLDNVSREFVTIPEDIDMRDLNIFVSNSPRDFQKLKTLRSMASQAVSAGASLYEASEILTTDSVAEIKTKLREINARMQEIEAQKNEIMKQQMEAEQQRHQEAMEMQRYKIDTDNATKIEVAEIQAYMGNPETDVNENMIPDVTEAANTALEERKIASEEFIKRQDMLNKEKDSSRQMTLKEKELALKNKEIDSKERIEELKARTALKVASKNKNKYDKK